MRVTRPTMNLSSMASPTTSTCAPVKPAAIWRARSGVSGGRNMIRARRGERQGDEDEEEHQELRVAEVVLEQPGAKHRRHGGQTSRRKHAISAATEQPEQGYQQRHDQPHPHRE